MVQIIICTFLSTDVLGSNCKPCHIQNIVLMNSIENKLVCMVWFLFQYPLDVCSPIYEHCLPPCFVVSACSVNSDHIHTVTQPRRAFCPHSPACVSAQCDLTGCMRYLQIQGYPLSLQLMHQKCHSDAQTDHSLSCFHMPQCGFVCVGSSGM